MDDMKNGNANVHVWSFFNDNFIHGRGLKVPPNYSIRHTIESHNTNPITVLKFAVYLINDDDNNQEIEYS